MIIRPAALADAEALSRIHVQSFDDGWTPEDIRTWIARPEGIARVADENREQFAFALALTAGDDAELLTIATQPSRRRHGLGHMIFAALDAEAARRGLKRWILEVARNNVPAIALYKSEGFMEIAVRKAYYNQPQGRVDALVMSRPVGSSDRHVVGWQAYVDQTPHKDGKAHAGAAKEVCVIEQRCIEKGLRMTEQRRVIARVLSAAEDHPDAEELHRRAAAVDPNISLATVYRTVKLFEDSGIIERHDFRDGRSRYEEVPAEHHDHLIDAKTGAVVEFHSDEIEKLQVEIARRLGYRLIDHRLELYGVPLTEDEKK